MRLALAIACTLVCVSPAVGQEFDASSLEQSLTSHPDRFGEDDFRIIDRNDDASAPAEASEDKGGAAPQPAAAENGADDGRGERETWDGRTKDEEPHSRSS